MEPIIFPNSLQTILGDVHKLQFGLLRSFCSAKRLLSLDDSLRLCLTVTASSANHLFLKNLTKAADACFTASAFCRGSPSGRFDMFFTVRLVDKT